MKNCRILKELICVLVCYILILTALPVQVIAVSNTKDTVINNRSLLVKEGDWLYYRNSSDGGSIYKIKTDGTQNTKINDISSCNITVNGDWIYFKNPVRDDKFYEMYRIRKDGSDLQDLKFQSYDEEFKNDYIYYDYGSGLNRIKVDGTENIELKSFWDDQALPNESIAGDYIYSYQYDMHYDENDDPIVEYKMFRCKLDGSDKTQIFSDIKNGYIIKATDNWIYIREYDNTSRIYSVYRIKPDGSDKTQIWSGDDSDSWVLIDDDWICDYGKNQFRKIDGSITINGINAIKNLPIAVTGNYICYHDVSGDFYAVKTDGTQKLSLYNSPYEYGSDYDSHLFSCINEGNYIYYINDYDYGEKSLYKFNINDGTSEKLTPDENIQKVSKDKVWIIKFTKEFDINTINDENILVTDGDNKPVKISILPNTDGKSITIGRERESSWGDPNWSGIVRSVCGKQIYNIKITQNVKDKDGQKLKRYVVKKFEIED